MTAPPDALDTRPMRHNTSVKRELLVNAPLWTEGLTFDTYPGIIPPDFHDVWTKGWSAVLWGPAGSGKTGLAVCALRALARRCVGSMFEWNMRTGPGNLAAVASGEMRQPPSPVWYESWPRLLAEYRRVGWNEPRWFTRLERRITVLMLDDIGLDTGTPYRESFLVRHIEWSYSAGRTLILTVNDPPEEWKRVLGERASDRLRDPKQFINVRVTQPSLR